MKHIGNGIQTPSISSPTTASLIVLSSITISGSMNLSGSTQFIGDQTISPGTLFVDSSTRGNQVIKFQGGSQSDFMYLGNDAFNNSKAGLFSSNGDQVVATFDPGGGGYSYSNNTYNSDGFTYHQFSGSLNVSGSITGSLSGTASYAITASYAMNGGGTTINTGSFITTGSSGTSQLISGSLTINQNLIVLGSASITNISQSTLNIGTNLITVNTNTPTTRFGGLAVIDSGSSPQRSGSLLFDSTNDQWIFVHQSSTTPTSSVLIMGPETYNNIGNETNLTTNKIPKSVNAEHISDSNITDTGTIIQLGSTTQITGSLNVSAGITGSLFGTSSWALNALTASYVVTAQTASYVLNAISSSYAATASLAPNYVLNSATSSFITNSQTSSMTVATASYVTGSVHNSTNPALSASYATTASFLSGTVTSASYAATASRVISSNGSAFTIQYGGGASGILMTGSSNLQYNGTNITLVNGKIAQSDGTNYYLYLGKTGLVGANETGIWSYDTALDNTYPITSYDVSTNKYYFANYQVVYNGANGFLGVGTSTPSAKLHVLGSSIISSSMIIGSSSLGPSENTLTLGARDAINEGGQLGFNAPGGTYTSASMIDLYQDRLRILKGTNAGSTGEVASWNMQTLQMSLPAYTSATSFGGTPVARLSTDSGGNIITGLNGYATQLDVYSRLGSTTKAESPFYTSTLVNGSVSPTNFQFHIQAMHIPTSMTVTGVRWYQATNGVYTAAASGTGVALYSYSAGTITLVASSSNQTIFSSSYGSASTFRTASFTSTYNASPGVYYIGFCWNPSATTTGPALGVSTQIGVAAGSTYDYTNSAAIAMVRNSIGALPSSQALSGMSGAIQTLYYLALY